MEKRKQICNSCGKNLSSYFSLWRHRKICNGDFKHPLENSDTCDCRAGRKRPVELVEFNRKSLQNKKACDDTLTYNKPEKVGSGFSMSYEPNSEDSNAARERKEKLMFAEVKYILNTIGKRINSGKTVDGDDIVDTSIAADDQNDTTSTCSSDDDASVVTDTE